MNWGDYSRMVIGHKYKEYIHQHEYRNILGAAAHVDPRKIFELPGDYDHIPDPMTQEEMKAQAIKLGYAHLLGIKPEC